MSARFESRAATPPELNDAERGLLAMVMQHMGDAVIALHAGEVFDCNPAAEHLLGRPRQAILGHSMEAFSPAQQRDGEPSAAARRRLNQLARHHGQVRFEWTLRRADDTERLIEVSMAPLNAARPELMLAMVRDITETRQRQAALAQQAQLLQTLCDHFPGGVTVMDRNLRLTLWNERFLTLMDLPPELFAQPITLPDLWRYNLARGEFGPVQDPDSMVASFTERALRFEAHVFTRVRPNGTVIEIRGEPIAEGGFVTTWVDVSEHQRLQTELHRHDALVAQVVNHMPQGISLFDEHLALQLWNQAFVDVLEFPQEAIFRGARFEDLLSVMANRGDYGPGDPKEQVEKRMALATQFQPHSFERTRPNGRTHLVEGQPVKFEERLAGFVTTYTDITTQKNAELALRRANDQLSTGMAERAEALSAAQSHLSHAITQLAQSEKLAALGNLVAGVAHELNTPIGNSVMAASTFLDRVAQFEREVQKGLRKSALDEFVSFSREAAHLVQNNLARAAELISAFKQVAVDQTSMRRRKFLLDECVEKTCATMAHVLRKGRHRFEQAIPQGLAMNSYPGALEQILTNLIGNSLMHGFEGREQGCIRIEAHGGLEEVVLTYQDDGVGMSAETVRRMFEPFFTTKFGQGGTGLGMHICHNLATTVLGGQIVVRSLPGQGSRFELTMPRHAPARGKPGGALT